MDIVQLKNWLKIQDKVWIASYIATLLLPWGLIFNRGIAEVSVATIGILFLANSFYHKQWAWRADIIIKLGLIAWVWLIFISVFAQNAKESIGVAVPWVRYILLYAALKHFVLIRKEDVYFLGKMLVLILCFVIIDTLWQYIFNVSLTGHIRHSEGRLTGPMDNEKVGIFIAKILLPSVSIPIFFAALKNNYKCVISSIILLILAIITILLSGERTAFASTMIAIFSTSFFLIIFEPKFRKFIFGSIIIIVVTGIFLLKTQDWVQERTYQFYETITNYSASEYGQLAKGGLLVGENNFLIGAGAKGFRKLCPDLLANGAVTTCNLHPHNIYIEWFAEAGIIGFLLFISIAFYLFFTAAKNFIKSNGIERLLPTFVIACLIVNLFPFMPTQSIFSNWPAILLFYSVGVSMATMNVLSMTNSVRKMPNIKTK